MSKIEEDLFGYADYTGHEGLQMLARFHQRKGGLLTRQPPTTMDPRHSSLNAVATGWEETRHVLETAMVYWL